MNGFTLQNKRKAVDKMKSVESTSEGDEDESSNDGRCSSEEETTQSMSSEDDCERFDDEDGTQSEESEEKMQQKVYIFCYHKIMPIVLEEKSDALHNQKIKKHILLL